jgi:glycosyltransferase involved in cell wall biosynthesis
MAADVSARHSSAENLVLAVRSFAVAEQIDAVVWVTDGPTAAFAFAVRLAPVQIFFSMKYHSFAAPEVDAYLTGGPAGQVFMTAEGREWRVAQTCYRDLFDSGRTGQAAKIRAALGSDRVILGCLGREQKIDSVPFLAAIAAVLRRTPNALFLWTGRDHVTGIQSALEREGVAAQCRFIGWVDTRVYAQVFDIFLDSFPFPCGVTALQAMAAAKPVVFFDSPEARETGVPLFVQPLIEGSAGTVDQQARARAILRPDGSPANFLMASDAGAYAGYAEALIADPTMRLRVGRALRDFVDAFLTDAEACGQSYERHIVDVIEAAAGSGGGPRAPFGHH